MRTLIVLLSVLVGLLATVPPDMFALKVLEVHRELEVRQPAMDRADRYKEAVGHGILRRSDDPSVFNNFALLAAGMVVLVEAIRIEKRSDSAEVLAAARHHRRWHTWLTWAAWPVAAAVTATAYLYVVHKNHETFWFWQQPGADAQVVVLQWIEGLLMMLPLLLGPAVLTAALRVVFRIRNVFEAARQRLDAHGRTEAAVEEECERLVWAKDAAARIYTAAVAPASAVVIGLAAWKLVLGFWSQASWFGTITNIGISVVMLAFMWLPFFALGIAIEWLLGFDLRFELKRVGSNWKAIFAAIVHFFPVLGFYVVAEWRETAFSPRPQKIAPLPILPDPPAVT